jgi:hypothetical protein
MRRRVLAYDLGLVVWAVLWIVVGVLVHNEVRNLAELSDPVVAAAAALEETAEGLNQVDDIPFVGEVANLPRIEQRVRVAARTARASARESRESVRRLARLLGISIALVPTLPLLALYLPLRRDWRRRR